MIDELNKLLRDSVNLILGVPDYAIKAKQKDAPRPTGAYGDVDFFSSRNIGWEETTFTDNTGDDDLTETNNIQRAVTMSIGFYRDNARDNAESVHLGLVRESIQTLFRSVGVGLTSRSEVRELSEALENGWEERAQIDVVLNVVGSDADVVRSILSLDIGAEYQFRGLSYITNIEVP